MENRKSYFTVTGIAVLVCLALSGCSKQASGTAGTSGSGGTSVATGTSVPAGAGAMSALPDNTLKIKVSVPTFGTDPGRTEVQQEWLKRVEAYLGCKVEITWTYTPWADYRNNEQVILASGALPDAFTYTWGDAINAYGEDGLVLDISKYTSYMTYYPRYISGTPGKEAMAYNKDGSGYYFKDGFVNDNNISGAQSFTGFIYRFDALQANNLTPATTLEEFSTLCAALKALYPSLYVISNSDSNYAFYRGFVGIFHTWDTLYWNGNTWTYGPVENNFRDMLRYIRALYAEGYIDPEFATDNGDAATRKATTGKTLIYPTAWAGMATHWNTNKVDQAISFGLAYLPQNSQYGTPWKWGSKVEGTSLSTQGFGIAVSAKAANPDWIVKLIDYQYSPEMVELQNWGIEGVTYTKTADGTKQFTPEILSAPDPVQALGNYGVTSSAVCRTGIVFTPQDFIPQITQQRFEPWWSLADGYHDDKYWEASSKYGGTESVAPTDRAPIVRLTADEATSRAQLITACDTVAKEYAVRFINGQLDLDKDWDSYVNAVKYAVDDFDGVFQMLNSNTVR